MVAPGRSSRCMLLLLALLAPAGCLGAATETPNPPNHHPNQQQQQQVPPTVGWAIQLSDIHISINKAADIQSDLQAFGALLGALQPAALLVSGDLVDAKLPGAVGTKQYPQEWQAYARLWRQLAAASGLPPSAVLDLRGNHDVFDTWREGPAAAAATATGGGGGDGLEEPRWQRKQGNVWGASTSSRRGEQDSYPGTVQPGGGGSLLDPFATWSAAADVGGAAAAAKRVTMHYLWPQLLLAHAPSGPVPPTSVQTQGLDQQQEQQGRREGTTAAATGAIRAGRGLTVKRGAWQQLFKQRSAADTAAGEQGVDAKQPQVCPAAALVGFDVTPRLGLHGLGDFFGVVTQQLVSDLETTLQQVRASAATTAAAAGAVGTRGKLHILPPGSSVPTGQSLAGAAATAGGGCGASIPIVSYSHQPTSMNYMSTSPAHTGVTAAAAGGAAGNKLHPAGSSSSSRRRSARKPATLQCNSRWCGGAKAVLHGLLHQWDVSWVLVGHLHTVPGDRMHRVTPKAPVTPGDQAGTYLAELEVGDWKDSRRWRLLVADVGTLTFADFAFINNPQQQQQQQGQQHDKRSLQGPHGLLHPHRQLLHAAVPVPTIAAALRQQGTPTAVSAEAAAARDAWVGSQPYSLQGVDPTRVAADRVVLLTWPPDARYSPLSQMELLRWQRDSWQARILLLPVYGRVSSSGSGSLGSGSRRVQSAVLAWQCVTRWGSSQVHSSGSVQLQQEEVERLHPRHPVTTGHQQQQQQQPDNNSSSRNSRGQQGASTNAAAAEQASVFTADLAVEDSLVACQESNRLLLLQAVVTTVADRQQGVGQALVSSSEVRPVILHPVPPTAAVKEVKPGGGLDGPPLMPLQLTVLERIALAWDWPLVLHIGFHVVWAGNLLLLVGPWLLCRYGSQLQLSLGRLQPTGMQAAASGTTSSPPPTTAAAAAAVGASWPRWSYTPTHGYQPAPTYGTWSSTATSSSPPVPNRGHQGRDLGVTAWVTAGISLVALGLWQYVFQPPISWLLVLVHHRPLWWAHLCYTTWLLLGPWVVVVKLTSYSRGPSLLTSYGYIAKLPVPVDRRAGQVYYNDTAAAAAAAAGAAAGADLVQWQYQLLPCPDLQIDLLPFMVLGVVPFTLWMGWVLATWSRLSCSYTAAAMSSSRSLSNGMPAAATVALAAPRPSLSGCATMAGQALLLLPVLAAWYRTCKRVWGHYGWTTLFLSPVLVWGPGLLLALLVKQLLRGGAANAAAVPRCPSCASLNGESRSGACKERSE